MRNGTLQRETESLISAVQEKPLERSKKHKSKRNADLQ